MNLPNAPEKYSREDQSRFRTEVAQEDKHNLKRNADVELAPRARILIRSPNGTRFKITVDNAGVLSAVAAL